MGVRPVKNLYDELKSSKMKIALAGDAQKSGTIAHAVRGGYDAALSIK